LKDPATAFTRFARNPKPGDGSGGERGPRLRLRRFETAYACGIERVRQKCRDGCGGRAPWTNNASKNGVTGIALGVF